ncbi:MAG: ABC transporter substrate-binding protein, partial [Planctomycetota bacterium]
MNKWSWLLLIVSCWMTVGFVMLGPEQDRNSSVSPLSNQAGRIVSLAPNLTEILFAIGLEDEIVGVTLDSDYPPEAVEKPKIGTFWQPNIEAVVAAKPSLVITLDFEQQKNLAERLKRIGYKNLTVNIEKVGDLFTAIETIGAATNR